MTVETRLWAGTLVGLWILLALAAHAGHESMPEGSAPARMVLVEGGSFSIGDLFGDGEPNETPVHQVVLSAFYLAQFEVTVAEFGRFVEQTGHRTSAEAPVDREASKRLMERAASRTLSPAERLQTRRELLVMGGTGFWDAEKRRWTGYEPKVNWRAPGFDQTDTGPVVAVSAVDAMNYCNWLSRKEGLPPAYAVTTWDLLDARGKPTLDISQVRGFRLPTEAEWEFAARERGRKVRFGNGRDIAKSTEINFRADAGSYPYLESGEYRKKTIAVGSFAPNSLGLYDMSGNAWEWTAATAAAYGGAARENPLDGGDLHALRGGRWGGDASEARVTHRSLWLRNDRCNNSGFRIARSR